MYEEAEKAHVLGCVTSGKMVSLSGPQQHPPNTHTHTPIRVLGRLQ